MKKPQPPKSHKLTEAQLVMVRHLEELLPDYAIQTEWPVCNSRRWRFDIAIPANKWAVELNGHWRGQHGAGWSEGFDKLNMAQALGWKVFVFHNKFALCGGARQWIAENLLGDKR